MISINKIIYRIVGWTAFYFPFAASAQYGDPYQIIFRVTTIQTTLRTLIGLLFAIATVIFLWGVVLYIRSSADEASRRKAQGIMMWGIIGLTVMTVAWGIVTIITNYFGVPTTAPGRITPPTFP